MKTNMKQLILASLLTMLALVFAANAQDEKRCPGAVLTEAEIGGILEVHNKARAEVNLSPLVWDCKLAEYAQEWAARGIFEHRPDAKFGESVWAYATANKPPATAMQQWMLEKPFWDNAAAACQTGKMCYHYTQIVWKKTAKIGCGINRDAPGKLKTLFVCNYDPAGNYDGPAY